MAGSGFDPETIVVGVIGRPHGVRGELKVRLFHAGSEFATRFRAQDAPSALILDRDGHREIRRVLRARQAADGLVIAFELVESREAAAALTGAALRVPRHALSALGPREFYVEDLPGCAVVDEGGKALGAVIGTFWNGAHDVMTVRDAAGAEILLPVVPDHIRHVDSAARRVTVRWEPSDA